MTGDVVGSSAETRLKIADVVEDLLRSEPDKARQAKERPNLEGWFVGRAMKRTNGEYRRDVIEMAVTSALRFVV